ncbi:tetraspanin-7 [Patella vulgata]|uniref:tetraspanin-7 n=1 Tax=Patella vulgata TaxID=6465 RepID=UPI00217F60DD|nr:tetraspanin-7 [Patella vulgata]XP_050418825.1 tetraspanin-7 [Patella vulgata]
MCECIATCGRLLITVFNLIFALVGIILLGLGIVVKVQSPMLDSLLATAQKQFQNAVSGAGFSSPSTDFNIYDLVGGLAIVFIALGCFFLVIGALGVIGACCKVRILLILYVILVIVILLAQIGLVVCVFAFRSVFDSTIKQGLKDVIKTEYTGINGTSAGNLGMNFIMTSQSCCGIDNYTDFSEVNAPNWIFRSYTDDSGNTHTLITPMACCKNTTSAPTCAKSPDATDATKNNYDKGCYDSLWEIVYSYKEISIGVVGGICGLQLLLVIFGISIICQIDKDKVGAI